MCGCAGGAPKFFNRRVLMRALPTFPRAPASRRAPGVLPAVCFPAFAFALPRRACRALCPLLSPRVLRCVDTHAGRARGLASSSTGPVAQRRTSLELSAEVMRSLRFSPDRPGWRPKERGPSQAERPSCGSAAATSAAVPVGAPAGKARRQRAFGCTERSSWISNTTSWYGGLRRLRPLGLAIFQEARLCPRLPGYGTRRKQSRSSLL